MSKYANLAWVNLTTDLTDNEQLAAITLVKSCLSAMGGKRPADLEDDEHTWIDAGDLISAGWTRHEAAGTIGSLTNKGFIQEYDKNQLILTTAAWQYLDTIWDESEAGDLPATNGSVVEVTYSYDRGHRYWVVTAVDAMGNQIGNAEFPCGGVNMMIAVRRMLADHKLGKKDYRRI